MRIIFSILIILLSVNKLAAQNLVPNPGFELINTCTVNSLSESYYSIENWFSYDFPANSPDIFNSCFTYSWTKIPNTFMGVTNTNHGDGIAGIALLTELNKREILSVELSSLLLKDSAYCFSMSVKNAYADDIKSWTNNLGAYFTTDTIESDQFSNDAHIKPSLNLDGNEWVQISGYYIASGNEKFLKCQLFRRPQLFPKTHIEWRYLLFY